MESVGGKVQKEKGSSLSDPDLISVSFEVDPSVSMVKDENLALAHYLKDHYMSVEIYDADSKFHYASCKLPLHELLRQQKSQVIRAKECEVCAPDSTEYRGSLQVVMSNLGKQTKTVQVPVDTKVKAGG